MDVMELNGGTVIATRGDGCVCIGSDLRLGMERLTVATNKPKVYPVGDHLFIGLVGLATDCQTVLERMKFRKNLYELKEGRKMQPNTFMNVLSNLLYERRFGSYFIEPIVAGLNPQTFTPYIAGADNIGCIVEPEDFVMAGTAAHLSVGTCEALWEKNMDQDALFEMTAQALLAAMDRNAASGWGAVFYTVTKDEVVARTVKARLD